MKMLRSMLCAAALTLVSSIGVAQNQAGQASNAQDEYVHISSQQADDDGVLRIFRSGDKQQINRYISRVVELHYAEAMEILPHVLKAVTLEGGTARTLKYQIPDSDELRFFMQVVTTERQMPSVIETIKTMDLPGLTSSEGDLKYAVRMRHRRASEVAHILSQTSLSSQGEIFADDISNTVWIFDSQSDGARDIAYIEFFDVPPPQVEFEVKVVEVTATDVAKIGLDWDAWKRSVGGQLNATGNWFEGADAFGRLDSLLTLDAHTLAEFLNFVTQRGTVKTQQYVRVTGSNESPAQISTMKRVPYVTYQRNSRSEGILSETTPGVNTRGKDDGNGDNRTVMITPQAVFPRTDIGSEQEGIEITIAPTIGTDLVTAEIFVSALTVDGYNELDEPIVSHNNLRTVATLEDGKPFLLGSYEREITDKYRRGIPGLKNIPMLKRLFSVEVKRSEKTRTFIYATPTFTNQLRFASHSMTSANFEKTPPVERQNVELNAAAKKLFKDR